MRGIIQIVGYLAGILVIGALLLDEGEVVTLMTEADDREYETHLWIVDLDGDLYIRANRPDAEWLHRLRDDPEVGLRWRDGIGEDVDFYRVVQVDDEATRDRVASAMARKHGFADRVRGALADDKNSVIMELLPVATPVATPQARQAPGAVH